MQPHKRQTLWPLHKVGLLYLLLSIAVLCSGIGYAIHALSDSNHNTKIARQQAIDALKISDEVLNQRLPIQHALANLKNDAINFQSKLEILAIAPSDNTNNLDIIYLSLQASHKELLNHKLDLIPESQKLHMNENVSVLMDIVNEVIYVDDHNHLIQTYWDTQEILTETISVLDEIDISLSEQNNQLRQHMKSMVDTANDSLTIDIHIHDRPLFVLAFMIVMILIMPISLIALFYRQLSLRINMLDKYAIEISKENYSLPPFRSKDTIGALGLRLNILGRHVRQLLEQSRNNADDANEERRKAEVLAYYDVLTGLPNRRHFIRELDTQIDNISPHSPTTFLLFLDLDNFKIINDTDGHEAGDLLLKVLAKRIEMAVRPGDIVARIGGDEFAAIVCCDDSYMNQVAKRILQDVAQPLELCGKQIDVSVSIGITKINKNCADTTILLKQADKAMYQSKQQGKNKFCYYNNELALMLGQKEDLKNEFNDAYTKGQFELYFQPKFSFSDQKICGCEALLRWIHPTQGLKSAGEFIKDLEQHPKILEIDNWIIRQGCLNAMIMHDNGLTIPVAINISARQFSAPGFIASVSEILAETGLPSNMLEFEITENMIVSDMDKAVNILTQLRTIGIRIAIDDFGTGYSSLSYLMQLPLDSLKIDKSFLVNYSEKQDSSIIDAIITLGKKLKLEIIAEGIETNEQYELLMNMKCNTAQGFLLSKPLPIKDILELSRPPLASYDI